MFYNDFKLYTYYNKYINYRYNYVCVLLKNLIFKFYFHKSFILI